MLDEKDFPLKDFQACWAGQEPDIRPKELEQGTDYN
jgi:hypothetical protein